MQRQHVLASGTHVQAINILGNKAVHRARMLKFGERIVSPVRGCAAHAPPSDVRPSPVALSGGIVVTEFLVGHGPVVQERSGGSAIVGNARFGADPGAGKRQNAAGAEHFFDALGGV